MFSCNTPSDRAEKDTVANVRATGEFVTNLVSRELAEAMNRTSTPLPHGDDEFRLAGLTKASSVRVRPPRVAASPAAFECRLLQLVEIDPEEAGDTPSTIVIRIGARKRGSIPGKLRRSTVIVLTKAP